MAASATGPGAHGVRATLNRIRIGPRRATGAESRLWGRGMVSFDSCHDRCAGGRAGERFLTVFCSRRHNLRLSALSGLEGAGELRGAALRRLHRGSARRPRRANG